MPFPYVQLLYSLLFVWGYTVGVPLAVKFGWVSLAVTLLLNLAFFGINCIGKELEDPFGTDLNDLDLEFFERAANAACKVMLPPIIPPDDSVDIDDVYIEDKKSMDFHVHVGVEKDRDIWVAKEIKGANSTKEIDPDLPARARSEFVTAKSVTELSEELRGVIDQYFDRYDTNFSGQIEDRELMQIVTQLGFALKMTRQMEPMLERVEWELQNGVCFTKDQFREWFLQVAYESLTRCP